MVGNKLVRLADSTVKSFIYGILLFSLICVPVYLFIFVRRYKETFAITDFVFILPAVMLMVAIYFLGKYMQQLEEKHAVLLMVVIEAVIAQ